MSSMKEPNISYRIMRELYPIVRRIYPNIEVPSTDLAHAMVHIGLHGTGDHTHPVLENLFIREMIRDYLIPVRLWKGRAFKRRYHPAGEQPR